MRAEPIFVLIEMAGMLKTMVYGVRFFIKFKKWRNMFITLNEFYFEIVTWF